MRLPIGLIFLPIILSLSPSCYAWYSLFTSAMDLLGYGEKLLSFLPNRTTEAGPTEIMIEFDRHDKKIDLAVDTIQEDIGDLKTLIADGLKVLPGQNSLVETHRYLQLAASKIGDRFRGLQRTQKELNQGKPDLLPEYFHKQTLNLDYIEDLWSGIKNTFLLRKALGHLAKDFITSKMVLENVCDAKASQLQLIEELFIYFQAISARVFFSTHIILNYFEKFHSAQKNSTPANEHANRRKYWNDDFHNDYLLVLNRFEELLKNISSKIWSCDPVRFAESNYLELKAFTKFYTRRPDLLRDFKECTDDCVELYVHSPQNFLDDCFNTYCSKKNASLILAGTTRDIRKSEIREDTRDCVNQMVDCKLKASGTGHFYVCVEKDQKKYKRYTSIQDKNHCDSRLKFHKITGTDNGAHPLDCVCPEETYYISTQQSKAENDHVIVGAQIQLSKDNILYINVKQGKPTFGGVIDPGRTKWLDAPLTKSAKQKISWGDCDEFDLSEITLPKDRVIVGLGFTCVKGRVHLQVSSKPFDLKTGTVGDGVREEKLIRGTKLHSVNNTDVPIKGRDKNVPINILKDGDYVKLALSSLEKDGGQTTVPFIDIQKVAPDTPEALSGASLVLRRQHGYGGFLGIQLFTFNVSAHMPPKRVLVQSEIDAMLMEI